VPHPIALSSQLSLQNRWALVLREYLALAKANVAGVMRIHIGTGLKASPRAITQRIQDWNCKV
jgi:hypothetical protein